MAKLLSEEILGNQKEIVSLVRERWKQGKRPSGSIIGEYRSFAYEQEKLRRNPLAGGNVDLIDTGSLNEKLNINDVGNSLFTIFSKDSKAILIAENYGLDVYGLTEDEEQMVLEEAGVRIINSLFKSIGL